jgi:hypothetical protein
MHTDLTVKLVETVTTSFGDKLRAFTKNTCPAFNTYELNREFDARKRRDARGSARVCADPPAPGISAPENPATNPQPIAIGVDQAVNTTNSHPGGNKRRQKSFSLNTYKVHALGDYAATIRRYGTTDSYSTEPVRNICYHFSCKEILMVFIKGELEHRSAKARYTRTNRKNFTKQITQIERRQARLRRIREGHRRSGKPQDEQVVGSPEAHHHIGKSQNNPEHITHFLRKNAGDPAVKVGEEFTPSHNS